MPKSRWEYVFLGRSPGTDWPSLWDKGWLRSQCFNVHAGMSLTDVEWTYLPPTQSKALAENIRTPINMIKEFAWWPFKMIAGSDDATAIADLYPDLPRNDFLSWLFRIECDLQKYDFGVIQCPSTVHWARRCASNAPSNQPDIHSRSIGCPSAFHRLSFCITSVVHLRSIGVPIGIRIANSHLLT